MDNVVKDEGPQPIGREIRHQQLWEDAFTAALVGTAERVSSLSGTKQTRDQEASEVVTCAAAIADKALERILQERVTVAVPSMM